MKFVLLLSENNVPTFISNKFTIPQNFGIFVIKGPTVGTLLK